jgi:glycosyltransferase involved in cell wall biosynthesis
VSVELSIVIPILNEEESIGPLYENIVKATEPMGLSTEIIFVNDGSQDRSFEIMRGLHRKDPRVKVIDFRRNFGQTAAMAAGFDCAKGKLIVSMDGDLQNDAMDIPKLLDKLEEGYDLVNGWRQNRKETLLKRRLPSWMANWLIGRITGVKLHDYGCTLKAYHSEIIKEIGLYGEMHRFIPALASWMGARIAEVPVDHHPRRFGKTKYGLGRTVRVILDLITVKFLMTYSTRPLHVFGIPGLISLFIGLLISAYLTFLKFFFHELLSQRPLILFGILLIFIGIQFISMGILAEIQARTYHEAQGKPIYAIREILE